MAFRFRKSKQILPGVKLNIGKKSASITVGGKGAHKTFSTTGKTTTTVGVPGTGLSYTTSKKKESTGRHLNLSAIFATLLLVLGIIFLLSGSILTGLLLIIVGAVMMILRVKKVANQIDQKEDSQS